MFANQGFQGLLRQGGRIFSGVDEATKRNIENCANVSRITRTSIGPNGLNKLIVNQHGKKYCTSDANTILQQLEVQHPAAKLLVMAAQMQHQEFGDGSNFVIILAAELLNQAEQMLVSGLHSTDILKGYAEAQRKLKEEILPSLPTVAIDFRNKQQLLHALKSVCSSKSLVTDSKIENLIADAVHAIIPENACQFDLDNVRVAKLIGGSIADSLVMNGMIVTRPPNGAVTSKGGDGKGCKVMMLGCGLEASSTEAKATVLLHSAQELLNFSKGDDELMEEKIKTVRDAGVDVIIVHGGPISDVAQHYCDKYQILTLKIQSKFEARRLCRALGCVAVVRLDCPDPEDLGVAESICVKEIGSKKVTYICARDTRVSTILLRGSTNSLLDEAERAIEAGVHTVKNYIHSPKALPGAGAIEAAIASQLQGYGSVLTGLEQYGVTSFGKAFEIVPRLLSESGGELGCRSMSRLSRHHHEQCWTMGVNLDGMIAASLSRSFHHNTLEAAADDDDDALHAETGVGSEEKPQTTLAVKDAFDMHVLDHMEMKKNAIDYAWEAVQTILLIDQIIMAKPAGGPSLRAPQAPDLD